MTTRLYLVTNKESGKEHLVDASMPSVARSHVAKQMFDVKVADTKTVAFLVSRGTQVESASASEQLGTSESLF